MSNGKYNSPPPATSSDRLRMFGLRTLGPQRTFDTEHRVRRLMAMATAPFRDVRRPIFIWGPGRTGSYLVYDVLSMHPDLVCPRALARDSKGLYGTQHYGGGEYDYLLANPFPPIEGYKRFIGRPHPHIEDTRKWTQADVQAIRRRVRRFSSGSFSGKRFLDKAPWYTYVTELLDEAFPDALHIRCLRDPVATAVSYFRRMTEPGALNAKGCWGWRPDGWEQFAERPMDDKATWLAIQAIRQAEANAQRLGSRCITVKYEQIVAQPRAEVGRVSEFLGLSNWQGRLDALPESFPNYNRPGTSPSSDPKLQAELDELCASMGYVVAG